MLPISTQERGWYSRALRPDSKPKGDLILSSEARAAILWITFQHGATRTWGHVSNVGNYCVCENIGCMCAAPLLGLGVSMEKTTDTLI